MHRAARIAIASTFAGAVLTLAGAWAPMFFLTEVSPVYSCSRAWRVDNEHFGVVLYHYYDWWLPVDSEVSSITAARIAPDTARFDDGSTWRGLSLYFTEGDTWATTISVLDIHSDAPDWAQDLSESGTPGAACSIARVTSGWPMRCFAGREICRDAYGPPRDEYSSSVTLTRDGAIPWGWELLPYSARPLALAVNVLTWSAASATLWCLVAIAPRTFLAAQRRRRNLCTSCGYSRQGLSHTTLCPECALAPRPR